MSSHFQNRLVGIIVLVALAVIFLPDLLDGKKETQKEQFAEIPLRPSVNNREVSEQIYKPVDLTESKEVFASRDEMEVAEAEKEQGSDWKIVETDSSAAAVTPKSEPKSQPKTQAKSEPVEAKAVANKAPRTTSKTAAASKPAVGAQAGYTLQLGSFKNAVNVNALIKQLRDNNFRAYTLPAKPIDGQLTKVLVGPELSKTKLQQSQKRVEKLTKLRGRIINYDPLAQ